MIKNIGIPKVMEWDVEHFTSPIGIKIRRFINPIFRRALRLGTKRKIIVEQYPNLDKKNTYIFSSSHSFDDDVISTLKKESSVVSRGDMEFKPKLCDFPDSLRNYRSSCVG